QAEHRDVRRRLVEALDAARNDARSHAVHLAHFHRQVGERLRLAKQREPPVAVALRQVGLVGETVIDLSLEEGAAAGAAYAGAAAVRKHVAGVEPGLQDGLALRHLITVAAGLQRDAMSHGRGQLHHGKALLLRRARAYMATMEFGYFTLSDN